MKLRQFTLNSRQFYEAVTPPLDPWVWAGGLPTEPRIRDRLALRDVAFSEGEGASRLFWGLACIGQGVTRQP